MKSSTILLLLLTCILYSCKDAKGYKEYVPTFFDGTLFYNRTDSLTTEHKKNIQIVFTYHNIPFKTSSGKIWYKGNLDDELLWNYTTKANDSNWLMSHSVKDIINIK